MARIRTPTLAIKGITWNLDRPGQSNISGWTGKRTNASDPWHGKWSAHVDLKVVQGESGVRTIRSFLARCKGTLNTFRLPATVEAQNTNSGVTVSVSADAGATSMTLSGYSTALLEGQLATLNDQLVSLTADQDSSGAVYFEPPLREAANAGTPVETASPYALVYMTSSSQGYDIAPFRLFGVSFDVEEAVAEPSAAGAALALEFKTQRYYANGKRQALLSGVSGYAFTRAGTQGAVAPAGTVSFFAANTPAIDSNGFHCYQALTNLALQSNAFDNAAWTKTSTTVTSTSQLDPTGNFAADTLADQNLGTSGNATIQQAITFTAGGLATIAFVAKAGGASWIAIQAQGYAITTLGAVNPLCYFNLATGTVGTVANGATGKITPLANGFYLCSIEFSLSGADLIGNAILFIAVNDNLPTFVRDGTHTVVLWQGQAVNAGGFNGRLPLIATTTAAASIGASDLEVGASLPVGDFLASATVNLAGLPGAAAVPFSYSTIGAGSASNRIVLSLSTSGDLSVASLDVGGSAQPLPAAVAGVVTAAGGRVKIGLRRKNNIYSLVAQKADGTVVIGADASGTGLVPSVTALQVGAKYDATSQINGRVEGVFQRNGTFTDADVTAILSEA